MINVDSRLIQEDLKKMGVDAFAVIMVITSHINAKRTAWPGIDRIRKMTGLSKARTYDAIKTLIELEHIERSQINKKGSFGKVIYRVTTKYLSIFMGADQFELEEEPLAGNTEYGNTEYGNTESAKPESGNPAYISISQEEVLSNLSISQEEDITDFKKSADGSPENGYADEILESYLEAQAQEKEKKSAKKEKADMIDAAVQLVQYFNEMAGRSFPFSKSGRGADNVKYVADLLKAGYTVDEIETMIQFKVWEWKDDPRMAKYLQPITIFKRHGKTYIEEALEAKKNPSFLQIVKKAKQHNDERNANSSRKVQPLVSADTQRKLLAEYIAEQQQRNGGKR